MLSQTHSPVGRPRLGPFGAGTVTAIDDDVDPARDRTFAYDALDRLTQSTGAYGTLDYTYDAAGNRLSRTITNGGTTTETYTLAAGSNRLLAVDDGGPTRMLTYTADGSVTTDSRGAGFEYLYNDAGRLVTVKDNGVTAATHAHNALGQRVIKTAGATTTHYHYDRDGRLLAETDGTGATVREYIHLDGLPLALVTGGTLYHVHPDHLATPQKMTDGTQSVVWDAQLRPFGEAHAIASTAANDQRFPGQLFDAETGFHYNYFRDYDPGTGRYLQSDPIGLKGGLNTYAYALGNPVINTDPTGEAVPAIIGLCAINPLCRAAAVGAGQLLVDALAAGIGIYAMSTDACEDAEDDAERCKRVVSQCRDKCTKEWAADPVHNDPSWIRRCTRECAASQGCFNY